MAGKKTTEKTTRRKTSKVMEDEPMIFDNQSKVSYDRYLEYKMKKKKNEKFADKRGGYVGYGPRLAFSVFLLLFFLLTGTLLFIDSFFLTHRTA